MKIKCKYCGELIDEETKFCTNCGAANEYAKSQEDETTQKLTGEPKTIEELKQWYRDRNLPDEETTRFFIGKDYKKPKAFGIYKDEYTERFVVYKNKADGTRAVRYEGTDEEFAVNQIYMKLKEEIANQKGNSEKKKKWIDPVLVKVIIFALIMIIPILFEVFSPNRGYYKYKNNYYYYQSGSWYGYNRHRGWTYTDVPEELKDNYSAYYTSSRYDSYYNIDSFEDSSYYVEPSSSSDSGSDWSSSDSWDSSSTDWDSDW